MADYLILKKTDDPQEVFEMGEAGHPVRVWKVHSLERDHTADVAGATEALEAAVDGPGRYGVVRVDNARTVQVEPGPPTTTADPDPDWAPPEEPV